MRRASWRASGRPLYSRRMRAAIAMVVAGLLFQAVAAMQQSPWRRLAHARAADLLFAQGRLDDARAAYRDALGNPAPEIEPAVAHFGLAAIAERKGDLAAAIDGYRRVYAEHPA